MSAAGASAHAGCGQWTVRDLAAHLVAEERLAGVSTFIARWLVARGIAVPAPPRLVDIAIQREHRYDFTELIDRLHRPVPRLLLRNRVAPLTLFEYWTHHDDLLGVDEAAHFAPPTLALAIPMLLRYQRAKLPIDVAVTVGTGQGEPLASVGLNAGPTVLVRGTPADLMRWLSGRRTRAEVTVTGPEAHVQALHTFNGHI